MTVGLHAFTLLASEAAEGGGAPPIVWGLSAFAILVFALAVVLILGKGRG